MSNKRYEYAKKQFTSWSYSRYRDYTRCPLFAKLKHLDKVSEGPDSPQMARGTAIGAMAEDFTIGKLRSLPQELMLFQTQFGIVRKMATDKYKRDRVEVEQSWCFDKNWNPIHHVFPLDVKGQMTWDKFTEADWTALRSIWLRVKMDLCVVHGNSNVLLPVDHKTGKYREYELGSYLEQLEIYALGGMLEFPVVRGASPRLWFLDEGIEYPQNLNEEIYYARSELEFLKKKWLAKVKPMFSDTSFQPKPNSKCQWCAYSKAKGGTCKY